MIWFLDSTAYQTFFFPFVNLFDVFAECRCSGERFIAITADKLFFLVSSSVIFEAIRGFESSQADSTSEKSFVFAEVVLTKFGRTGKYLVTIFTKRLRVVYGIMVCVFGGRWELLLEICALCVG